VKYLLILLNVSILGTIEKNQNN